jgi:hypothetical protein
MAPMSMGLFMLGSLSQEAPRRQAAADQRIMRSVVRNLVAMPDLAALGLAKDTNREPT